MSSEESRREGSEHVVRPPMPVPPYRYVYAPRDPHLLYSPVMPPRRPQVPSARDDVRTTISRLLLIVVPLAVAGIVLLSWACTLYYSTLIDRAFILMTASSIVMFMVIIVVALMIYWLSRALERHFVHRPPLPAHYPPPRAPPPPVAPTRVKPVTEHIVKPAERKA